MKVLEDTKDGKKRYIQLNIPVTEGDRYKVGNFNFDGNKVIKSEGLRPLFKLNEGDYYSEKKIRRASSRRARSTAPAATGSSPATRT